MTYQCFIESNCFCQVYGVDFKTGYCCVCVSCISKRELGEKWWGGGAVEVAGLYLPDIPFPRISSHPGVQTIAGGDVIRKRGPAVK